MIRKILIKKSDTFLLLICVFSVLILTPGICLSAPVGNPAGPILLEGNYPTKFSMETETVFERELESSGSGNPKFKGVFYTGKVSLYLGNKLDIYGLVGAYDGKVNDFIDKYYIIDTKADVVVGVGVSYVLREMEFLQGILRLGFDAKYRQFDPEIDTVKYYREKVDTTGNSLSFKEWQASLGLAYQYKNLIPYIGLKYSDMGAHVKFTHDGTSHAESDLSSKDIFGLFYGIDVLVADNISLNLEKRNLDENAFNIGLNTRF